MSLSISSESSAISSTMSTTTNNLDNLISDFLTTAGSFSAWYDTAFIPAFKASQERHAKVYSKNLAIAQQLKRLAEEHAKIKSNTVKAFECINEAIKTTPHTEHAFLASCFLLRSTLHESSNQQAALLDIEKALILRPYSYSAINRKVALLEALSRSEEAYRYLDEVLVGGDCSSGQLAKVKVEKLRAKRRQLMEFAPDPDDGFEDLDPKTKPVLPPIPLTVDSRLRLAQNTPTRYTYYTTGLIPNGTSLLEERPPLLILKASGRRRYCESCWADCKNTFWPCPNCLDVIFCSNSCAGHHQEECGLLELLEDATKLAVYRLLTELGHEKMLELDRKISTFPLEALFSKITSGRLLPSSSQMTYWFALYQFVLIHSLKSPPTSKEIGQACFILALYLHQTGLGPNSLTVADFQALVRVLSCLLVSVSTESFNWSCTAASSDGTPEDNDDEDIEDLGEYHLLFGSRIHHSCTPNAQWSFNGSRFILRATSTLEPGTPLMISYGVKGLAENADSNVLKRQATLWRVLKMMCNCGRCLEEVKGEFSMTCGHCGGPVPWKEEFGLVEGRCMCCEGENYVMDAKKVWEDLQTTQKSIWLLATNLTDTSKYLPQIELKVKSLLGRVHLENHQLLSTIQDLCEVYLSGKQYGKAVDLFTKLVVQKGLYLTDCSDLGGQKSKKSKISDDFASILEHVHSLDLWLSAFLNCLEAEEGGEDLKHQHLAITRRLLNELTALAERWRSPPRRPLNHCLALLDYGQIQPVDFADRLTELVAQKKSRYEVLVKET